MRKFYEENVYKKDKLISKDDIFIFYDIETTTRL